MARRPTACESRIGDKTTERLQQYTPPEYTIGMVSVMRNLQNDHRIIPERGGGAAPPAGGGCCRGDTVDKKILGVAEK
jgi:hypothetical protein